MKHRFASEEAIDAHAVQAAHEFIVEICLNGMGPTQFGQTYVGVDELGSDPSTLSLGIGAPLHDAAEVGIHPNVESTATGAERLRNDEAVERDDAARIR